VLQPSPLSPSFAHYLLGSNRETALKGASCYPDIAAYLRSIGTPEWDEWNA
jgi:hypothetical protein